MSLALKRPEQAHPRLHAVVVDLMDPAATQQAAVELAKRFAVTHFVHNAGVIRSDFLSDMKLDDLNALSQLHLGSAITLAQAVLPSMKQSRFGRIVLMSSRGALGLQTRTAYAATKSGMMGMARTWALELAADGITVNVIAPGPIGGTDMFHAVIPKGSDREAALGKAIPVQRLGRPDDVARTVMFFCDRANSFITGQTLYVCGGASLGSITI